MMVEKRGLFGRTCLAFALLGLLIVSPAIVAASVSIQNVNIPTSYGPGQLLDGSLDILLGREAADSQLTLSLFKNGNEIGKSAEVTLVDFLKSFNANVTCSTDGCLPNYTAKTHSSTLDISNGKQYVGLLVKQGNSTQINSITFNITGKGDAESCGVSPLSFDLLDDQLIDWESTKVGGPCDQLSPSDTYDSSSASSSNTLGDIPYCEKMSLPRGGSFLLGANIINSSSGAPITISINNIETGESAECNPAPMTGIASCMVNFTVPEKKDLYICVQSTDGSGYKINSETKSPNCGKFGLEQFTCDQSLIDYAIYAQPMAFGIFNETVEFNADAFNSFNPQDLVGYIQSYIDKRYSGNCDGGCVVPIKISSTQDATLSGLSFKYTNNLGSIESNDFYKVEKDESEVSTNNFTRVRLSKAGLNMPAIYGKYLLSIYAGSTKVFDSTVTVDQVPNIKAVTPTTIFAAVETQFQAFVESPKNDSSVKISNYAWDFGDGTSDVTTDKPFASHTYPSGNYILTLTATDSTGLSSSRSFDIMTKAPIDAINSTLASKKSDLAQFVRITDALPKWYSDLAKSSVNLQKIAEDLESLRTEFLIVGADYAAIKTALDQLVVYSNIKDDQSGSIQVLPSADSKLLIGFGETVIPGREAEISRSIESWDASNVKISLKTTTKNAVADTKDEDNVAMATLFEATISSSDSYPKNNIYFVVKLPSGMNYDQARFNFNDSKDLTGAFGVKVDKIDNTRIEFALPGKVAAADIQIFASPSLNIVANPEVRCGNNICESSFGEDYLSCPEDCKKPISSAIWLSSLIVIISLAGIYLIWKYYAAYYDNKLRHELFPKDSDFYNLSFFIANEMNKGASESKIRESLAKAEWKQSQIDYGVGKVKEQTKKIQRQSILNFVLGEIKSGKTDAEIRVSLASAGWEQKLIDWAMKKAKTGIKQ